MSNLTWREVAAPDFRSSMDGYTEFSKLLSTAFSGLKTGLNDFDKAKSDRVNSDIMARIAAAQSPDAAKQLAAQVPGNVDTSRINSATWQSLMGRPGDLTKQAAAEGDLSYVNYTRDRTKEQNSALDAARPDAVRFIAAAASGDDATASKILAESPTLQGMTAEQVHSLVNSGQDLTKGNLSIAGTRENQREGKINFGNEQTDREEGRQATALQGIIRMNGVEPADFDTYVTQNYDALVKSGISPVVIEKARHAVLSDPTSAASFYESGSLGSGGGAGAGAGGLTIANNEARAAGISGIPDTVKTMGDWSNWASGVNARGVQSSAAGLYQITGETLRDFAPQVLGSNWQSQAFTPENQDKIGRAIFESTKGDPRALMSRWTSLNAAEAQQAASLPWEQARNIIAQGESGVTNVAALLAQRAQDTVGVTGPQYNRSQDSGQAFARGMLQAMGSDADVRSVASGLVGKDGILAGEDVGNVAGVIKEVAQQYHISPAAAGLIISKSTDANKNWYQRVGDNFSSLFGGGDGLKSHIDWKAVEQYGSLARNRDALLKQVTASTINDASSQLVASSSQAATAAQQAARAKILAAARLGRKVNPSSAIAQAALAADTHSQALGNAGAVTQAGGDQPTQAPKIDRHNVPQHAAPAPALNAQRFLERQFQAMIPNKAGPAQLPGIKAQFQQKFGISIDQVRSNPNLAWEVAKKLDNRAAAILSERASNRTKYFRR